MEDRGRADGLAADVRGTTGAVIGMLFASVVVVSAVTAGVAAPSSGSADTNSQERVDSVAVGMENSVSDANAQRAAAEEDEKERRAGGNVAASNMPDHALENVPDHVREKLERSVGSYASQIEAQNGQGSEVTHIEPAGNDSVTTGVYVRQEGDGTTERVRTGTRYVEVDSAARADVTERRQVGTEWVEADSAAAAERWEERRRGSKWIEADSAAAAEEWRYEQVGTELVEGSPINGYAQRRWEQTGTERVKVGEHSIETRQRVKVGTERVKVDEHTYETQVEVTKTRPETRTETYQVRESYWETVTTEYTVKVCNGVGNIRVCEEEKRTKTGQEKRYRWVTKERTVLTGDMETYTVTEERTITVPVYETRDVYEWQTRSLTVPTYDEQPTYGWVYYDRQPVYDHVPYEEVPVYEDVPLKEVPTYEEVYFQAVPEYGNVGGGMAEFTYDGQADWTVATGVTEARRATVTVARDTLATSAGDALTLRADGANGDWTMTVWKDGNDVVVETSTGVRRTVSGSEVTIDLVAGTVAGADAGIALGGDLDSYTLRVENGDNAYGTYEFLLDGNAARGAAATDSVTLRNDVVYQATFDITYSSRDTTYTDRVTVEPSVN